MYQSKQLHYSSFFFVSFARFATAWTSPGLAVDLAWPPIGNEGYFTQNGQFVAPNIDSAVFPCAGITPPITTTLQSQFPLTGARLQFSLHNSSVPAAADYSFVVNAYLGQFSNDADPDKTGWTYLTTWSYEDFTSGSQCTDPLNITDAIVNAPTFNLQLNDLVGSSLVGVSVTLGLRTVLFDGDENFEEMYQCSYLNLVADDASVTQNQGLCNISLGSTTSSSSIPPTSTATSSGFVSTRTSLPSSTSVSTPTNSIGAGNVPANGGTRHTSHVVGIAVGASAGAAVLLVLLGLFLLRCRRSRRRSNEPELPKRYVTTVQDRLGPNYRERLQSKRPFECGTTQKKAIITASEEREKEKDGVVIVTTMTKAGDDGNDGVSVGGSEHSEPLPVYYGANDDTEDAADNRKAGEN